MTLKQSFLSMFCCLAVFACKTSSKRSAVAGTEGEEVKPAFTFPAVEEAESSCVCAPSDNGYILTVYTAPLAEGDQPTALSGKSVFPDIDSCVRQKLSIASTCTLKY